MSPFRPLHLIIDLIQLIIPSQTPNVIEKAFAVLSQLARTPAKKKMKKKSPIVFCLPLPSDQSVVRHAAPVPNKKPRRTKGLDRVSLSVCSQQNQCIQALQFFYCDPNIYHITALSYRDKALSRTGHPVYVSSSAYICDNISDAIFIFVSRSRLNKIESYLLTGIVAKIVEETENSHLTFVINSNLE